MALAIGLLALLTVMIFPLAASAQRPEGERTREGVFEITLKTTDSKRIIIDELVRDRDLSPKALYRVRTGGYLAFDESEWVDKIEFKAFDVPVTELAEYKKLSTILTEINNKIWTIKEVLGSYNQLSLRLMNICNSSMFPTLRSIDENISQQLEIYKQLMLLRDLIVNALNRFVRDRTCVDKFDEYKKGLSLYSQRLTNLCKDFDRLRQKALDGAKEVKSGLEGAQPIRKP
jgi:hypothetical protein